MVAVWVGSVPEQQCCSVSLLLSAPDFCRNPGDVSDAFVSTSSLKGESVSLHTCDAPSFLSFRATKDP